MFQKQKWFIIQITVKKYYSSLAENFVLKLLKPPNNFGIKSVNNYKKCNLKERLQFSKIESGKVFKIIKNFDESKLPGINDFQKKVLKRIPKTTVRSSSYHLCQKCWRE